MKLLDTGGGWLKFLAGRNTDGSKFATKRDTRNAFLKFLRGEDTIGDALPVYYTTKPPFLAYAMGVTLVNGKLSIGCHTFNRENSKRIIRWMGVTSAQVVAARKANRNANA